MNAEGKFLMKHKLEGLESPVVVVLWSPDDRQVITCGENEVIKRWDVGSGDFVQSYEKDGVGSVSCGWFHDGSGIIGAMEARRIYLWNLDGKWVISVGREQREISFFDRETGRVENVIQEKDMITSFSLSKDNKHLLIDLITQKIHAWSIEGGTIQVFETGRPQA
uniref:Uncharacterized protein n=1 Tax=Noccaea caerulescens TaxID=107243 RepID=A0A1J3GCJ8_NOCCA